MISLAVSALLLAPALPQVHEDPVTVDTRSVARMLTRRAASPPAETRAEVRLPELGRTLIDVRRPQADGRVERFAYDVQTGERVDLDQLRRLDHAAGRARRGGLHPTLFERVEGLAPDAPVEVAFWLVEPAGGTDWPSWFEAQLEGVAPEAVSDAIKALRVQALEANEAFLAPTVAGFAETVRGLDGEVRSEGLGWPVVIAEVRADRVATLAADERVDAAYVSQTTWLEEGEDAQGTMRTPSVHAQGVTADGSVRVLVNDTAQVQTDNSFLPPIITLNGSSEGSHATGVAGNIANVHPQHRAAAYSLPNLYTAGGAGDSGAQSNWNTGIANGIDMGNCSWWNGLKGQIQFLDRFFDYTIRNFSVMMFKSNGNQGNTSEPYGTTPGQGYNMTCSGAYSDGNNITWSDDAMASSSSYWDPIEGHVKPEVAAPGTGTVSTGTGTSGLQTFSGTSSASPLTCGVAALLASDDNTLLTQMTTLKAVLMVSAWIDVAGPVLITERDGAGGVHAKAAHSVVRDQQWDHRVVTNGDFSGGVLDVPMPLLKGESTRVIALWFSSANSSFSTDVLDMDLDLVVLDPLGTPVASAASATDAFELAEFTAAMSGTYTVRLTRQRFDGTSEPLTVAWSTRNDIGTVHLSLATDAGDPPFALGQLPRIDIVDPYNAGGNAYFMWASFEAPGGIALTQGYTAPMGWDFMSPLTIDLPGFQGTLNANGIASATFFIPNLPILAGLDIGFGLVESNPAGTGFKSVSDPPLYLTVQP